MAAELFTPPSKALDANADPYAGAKWFFYLTGTTTPQSVFTTAARDVPHSNPVVADSTGKFANIYFDESVVYRAVLKNLDETVILHDIDPVNSSTLAALLGTNGSAFVGFQQAGTGAAFRSTQAKGRDTVSANDFGVSPSESAANNTTHFNAAIAYLCSKGGGTVTLGNAASYSILGPILVPNDITVDLCGQTIAGGVNDLFQSGKYTGGTLASNILDGDEVNIVQNATIRNGNITGATRVFNLKNFNQECVIENIKTRNCLAVGYYKRCFSMTLANVTARGGSSVLTPTHHFDEAINSVLLDRVKCVTEYGFRFTGGSSGVDIRGWEFEGGTKGFVFEGDNLNVSFSMGYGEAVTGKLFDFSAAGACLVFFQGNYINGVQTCFDDGGVSSPATLNGIWLSDNSRVNSTGNGYTNIMSVAGRRNFIQWNSNTTDSTDLTTPTGWVLSKATDFRRDLRWNADAAVDVRAVARHHDTGIIPTVRSGDTGAPFLGTVPFCTVAYPTSATATITIDTKIKWQPNSLFAKYIIDTEEDATGALRFYGDIFGSAVKQGDAVGRTVAVSDNGGFVRLSIGTLNNTSGLRVATGTVQVVA